jgi:hypothetical protein
LELQSAGSWQTRFKIIAGRDLSPPSTLPPFNSITSAIDYLVRPLEGFFFNGRRLGHITIQHPEITPQFGILKLLDFPLLNQTISDKDLVPEKPHSLFFVNRTHFFIYMPPRFKKISG